MRITPFVALGGLLFVLACGGLDSGSAKATKLCELLTKEREIPCHSAAFGQPLDADGMTLVITGVKTWKAENGRNSGPDSSRLKKAGMNTLVVEYEVTNNQVVKQKNPWRLILRRPEDGEAPNGLWGSQQVYNTTFNRVDPDHIGPGKTVKVAQVFPAAPGNEEGILLEMYTYEKRPDPMDPRGREKRFYLQQWTMEAPKATPAG
jgi:hypothetical protein